MSYTKSHRPVEEINPKKLVQNTRHYLEKYLNPHTNWDKEIAPKERIHQIKNAQVNWDTVSWHIKKMNYKDFLNTPYWKAIAAYTKYRAGYRCQLCNRAHDLVTHHRSYDIHGREHDHMYELIAICDYCHRKFHNKIPESKNKISRVIPYGLLAICISLGIASLFIFFRQERWSLMISKINIESLRETKDVVAKDIFSYIRTGFGL